MAIVISTALTASAEQQVRHREVLVSLSDRQLAVLEDGWVLKVYAISVGAPTSPSPEGDFQIVTRIANPTYYHPGKVIGPGKRNPLGTRWMGLSKKSFGIHGTNQPRSIGKAASHGCIRMRQQDLEELFAMLQVGDQVHIRGQRDAQVAAIFSKQPEVQLAQAEPSSDSAEADGTPAQ